jgi:chorismate mutase
MGTAERRMLLRKRQRMDRLNLRIRNLVQERARLAAEIARWKHARGANVPDAEREIQMLQRVLRNPGTGFDRAALARIFAVLFDESRQVAVHATTRKRRG